MIWSVVSKCEMMCSSTTPVFRHYHEAVGKERIRLAVVEDNDTMDFIKTGEIVLPRSASKGIIKTIREKGVRSTAEKWSSYELANDKANLYEFLSRNGVCVPKQHKTNDTIGGNKYFVKPRYGSDSSCITDKSICMSMDEVKQRVTFIEGLTGQDAVVEDFIDGIDCTVSLWRENSSLHACAIAIECPEHGNIQTKECKSDFSGFCSPLYDKNITTMAKDVFNLLGLRHHARMDFRMDNDGGYWLIDVNLIPGLSPIGLWAKCLLLSNDMSYKEAVNAVIRSSSRT